MNFADNGSLSRVVTSRLPVMRRSASSDAILSSYLYGRWPRLDALNAEYYMKIQSRAVHEFRLQPLSSAETIGANSVLHQEASEDASVSEVKLGRVELLMKLLLYRMSCGISVICHQTKVNIARFNPSQRLVTPDLSTSEEWKVDLTWGPATCQAGLPTYRWTPIQVLTQQCKP